MKYLVLDMYDEIIELTKHVNDHIETGWKPLGGIAICVLDEYRDGETCQIVFFSQAMVKE